MNNSKIIESTVVRGNDTFKVFSEDGILQTPDPLKSFTPITFYNIEANQNNIYLFAKKSAKSYQTEFITRVNASYFS